MIPLILFHFHDSWNVGGTKFRFPSPYPGYFFIFNIVYLKLIILEINRVHTQCYISHKIYNTV